MEIHSTIIPPESAGIRADLVLAGIFSQYSRSRIQEWIRSGVIKLNGLRIRTRYLVKGGEIVTLDYDNKVEVKDQGENIPLEIVYEDESILVINKPSGLVVHPAAGNRNGTVLNALLHYLPELEIIPRGGIVHRLDKNTTGLMVVAKTLHAQNDLVKQLQSHSITRIYHAVVSGVMISGGTVDAPIGRHPVNRKRMAVVSSGKIAVSHYRIIEKFQSHTYIKVQLETGRTHQIRVHMSYNHFPIVGDPVYGGRQFIPKGASLMLSSMLREFPRQALHAKELSLVHPITQKEITWKIELPEDMISLLYNLQTG